MLLTISVGFLLMPFLVHHLGDHLYGYWALVGAILGYYGVLDFGIVTSVEWHVAKAIGQRKSETANRAISTAFFVFAFIGAIILVSSIVVALMADRFVSVSADAVLFRKVVLITGAGFAIGFPGRAFLGALSAHLRWDVIAVINQCALLLRTAVFIVIIEAGLGLVALAIVSVVIDLLSFAGFYLALCHVHREFRLSRTLATFPELRDLLSYSIFTFIIKMNDQLRLYIDPVVVTAFIGVSAVTHYAVGQRVSLAFREFMISVLGMLAPWFGRLFGSRNFDSIRRVLELGTRISVSLATTITCLLLLYGRAFIESWMGKNYLDGYWVLFLLTAAAFFEASQFPSMSYLYGVSRHKYLACITLLEAGVNVGLSLYFVRLFGIAGVALGTAVPCLVVRLILQPIYICRHANVSLRRYYAELYGRTALVTALAVIVPWALFFRWLAQPRILTLAAVITGQCLLAIAAVYTLAFPSEDRSVIARALRKAWTKPKTMSTEECLHTA
ncbi:MAG: polysaccharide biosynthesis protein [Acidobacteria bacterium]|nr:polysaccharide biosynthesis protein [Acidobacteriota bacterium]